MDPKFQPKTPQFKRPKILAHILSALSLGLGFALVDRANNIIVDYIYPRENLVDITENLKKVDNAADKRKGDLIADANDSHQAKQTVAETQQVKFKRDEYLSKLQKKSAETQDPVDKKTLILKEIERRRELELHQRFLMNFLYGLVFAKLGSEINLKLIYRKVPGLVPRLLITSPASVLAYYTFSNFYEGKSAEELIKRLRGDILTLVSFRVIIEYPANALLRREVKGKAIPEEAVRGKLARNKSVSAGLWILLLTYMYQYSPLS